MVKPEYSAPPEIFYGETESVKYTSCSRNQKVQAALAERALEMLLLPPDEPCMLLDIGCGSGLSGEILSQHGHFWTGVDISESMLNLAVENGTEGELILNDIGQLTRFRPGIFDGVISISTIQWLLNADKKSHNPYQRIMCFFKWLYNAMKIGARAVLHAYVENAEQLEIFTSAIVKCNFGGGVVVDFPDSSKARKYFFVLWAGTSSIPQSLPSGLTEGQQLSLEASSEFQNHSRKKGKNREKNIKNRKWVIKKKATQRKLGKVVRPDTKYTGRKRPDPF